MQKRRALSLFLVLVMVFSLLPGTVQASGETAAIAIQEKTITTSTTTVTVKVTGYEGLSNATLRLSVGPGRHRVRLGHKQSAPDGAWQPQIHRPGYLHLRHRPGQAGRGQKRAGVSVLLERLA